MKQLKYIFTLLFLLTTISSTPSIAQVVNQDTTANATEKQGPLEDEEMDRMGGDSTDSAINGDTTRRPQYMLIEPVLRPRLKAGIRVGINQSNMVYSYDPISRYEHSWRNIGMLGFFVETPIGKTPISLRPEITLLSRGNRLNWLDVNYEFIAHYVDFRLPVTWNFSYFGEKLSPYLMVVPQLNIPYDGIINYTADDFPTTVSAEITKADIKAMDVSLMFGAGIDIRIDLEKIPVYLSLEAGYNMGLLNNLAPRERYDTPKEPSVILNNFFGAELWRGKRHTRGLEIAARISLPIDGKYIEHYKKMRAGIPDTIVRIETQYDTIYREGEPILVEREMPEMRAKTSLAYQTKECFTIAELYNLMDQGADITGRRICMFDINFDFDSYEIREESYGPLNELVQMMLDYPQMTVEIFGHTDSIGTAEYNQRLSENRAHSVVEYLADHGISPSRIRSYGYGLKYPIDTNSTPQGRFRNRRVEFDVITIGQNRKYR